MASAAPWCSYHIAWHCPAASSVPHLVSLVRWVREEFEKTRVFRSKETRVFRSKGPEAFFFRLEVVMILIFAAVLILGFSREIPHLHISY